MKANRDPLRMFLNENGCKITEKVMAALELFYQIAESEVCKPHKEKINEEEIKKAVEQIISTATGKTINKAVFMSRNVPSHDSEVYQIEEVYKNSLRVDLRNVLKDILENKYSLKDSLNSSLKENLWNSFWDRLGSILWNSFRVDFWDIIFLFVGFSLANQEEMSSRFEPLLQLVKE